MCETKLWRKSIGSSLILVKAHVGRVLCVRRSSGVKALALLWFLLKLMRDVSCVRETKLWWKSIGSSLILVKAHVGRVRCARRSSGGKALALLWFLLKLMWDVSCVCETKLWWKSIGSSLILVKAHVGRVRCARRSSGGKALALLWFLLKLMWDVSCVWDEALE